MLVARLHAPRELVVHDEPMPEPGPGEVLVRVDAVGLCGSDTHWWETAGIGETLPGFLPPLQNSSKPISSADLPSCAAAFMPLLTLTTTGHFSPLAIRSITASASRWEI